MFQIAYDSWAGKFGLAWKSRCLPSSQINDGSLVVFVFVSGSLKEYTISSNIYIILPLNWRNIKEIFFVVEEIDFVLLLDIFHHFLMFITFLSSIILVGDVLLTLEVILILVTPPMYVL